MSQSDALTAWILANPVISFGLGMGGLAFSYVLIALGTRNSTGPKNSNGSGTQHGHTCPACNRWHSA